MTKRIHNMNQLTGFQFRSALLVIGLLAGFMLQGCGLTIANIVTPDSGYKRVNTLSYGESDRQTLDIYHPAVTPIKPQVLVFFYGGAWEEGDKNDYRFVAQAFAKHGYRIAIPDYRLYPDIKFPTFIEDSAMAVAAVAEQFPDSPMILMGHSAGAQIAALLAFNKNYLNQQGVDTQRVGALIGWSGPYDFLPLTSETLKKIFVAEQRDASQPINFVSEKAPPTLLIHGLDDSRVKPANSKNLAEKLRLHNVPVSAHYYEGVGHVGTVGSLIRFLSPWSDTLPDTLAFLDQL